MVHYDFWPIFCSQFFCRAPVSSCPRVHGAPVSPMLDLLLASQLKDSLKKVVSLLQNNRLSEIWCCLNAKMGAMVKLKCLVTFYYGNCIKNWYTYDQLIHSYCNCCYWPMNLSTVIWFCQKLNQNWNLVFGHDVLLHFFFWVAK